MRPRGLSVIINVERLDTVTEFYGGMLRIPIEKSWNDESGSAAILDLGPGRRVEFVGPPYTSRTDPMPARGVELMIEVDDAKAWLDRLSAAGVVIARALIENPWGDRSFGIDDPEGRRVWIYEIL